MTFGDKIRDVPPSDPVDSTDEEEASKKKPTLKQAIAVDNFEWAAPKIRDLIRITFTDRPSESFTVTSGNSSRWKFHTHQETQADQVKVPQLHRETQTDQVNIPEVIVDSNQPAQIDLNLVDLNQPVIFEQVVQPEVIFDVNQPEVLFDVNQQAAPFDPKHLPDPREYPLYKPIADAISDYLDTTYNFYQNFELAAAIEGGKAVYVFKCPLCSPQNISQREKPRLKVWVCFPKV